MNRMIYAFALAMVICLSATVYSQAISQDLQNNVVRLHIIANSDSKEDQEVKLAVRNAILEMVHKNGNVQTLDDVKETADAVLKENGFTYTSKIKKGKFYFPEKTYKDTTFPSGEYNAVQIILGKGQGKNWWCVMNPPLCFDEDTEGELSQTGKEQLKSTLNEETYELITEKPEIKFKLVEVINEFMKNN